nr:ubiquitin carboxyl-terminal hydrolase 34-like [Lytechinus pictus]
MRFVEGCLENLKQHRSVVVSLRLIPKLFASFQQYRNNYNTHWITMWAERELGMMNLFFADLLHYTGQVRLAKKQEKQLYTHKTEIQTRLQFLTCVFSTGGSPDHFRLTLDQVDTLWSCLALDSDCSDEALNWFLQQANNKDQHALGLENFKHIFFHKMPQLEPDSISMTGLNLFQQLCSLARLASSASYNSPSVEMPGIDHLWKIALRAKNTDVSLSAIQYINSYYINAGNGTLEKEEEFIERCMESLSQASADLDSSLDASLLVLQRGLILLKTHLEAFRKRYAYHLRQWQLEGCGIVSHQKHLLDSQAATIRILCQIASVPEKDVVGGHELIPDLNEKTLKEMSFSDARASLGSSEHSSIMADMAAMKFISCRRSEASIWYLYVSLSGDRDDTQWNFWEQECLASVLKLINEFASEEALNEPSSDLDEVFDEPPSTSSSSSEEVPRKRARTAARQRKDSTDSGRLTVRFSAKMQELLAQSGVLERLMGVLYKAASPGDSTLVQAGYWVVHYAMKLLVSWASTDPEVKMAIGQYEKLDQWLRLTLQTNEVSQV